MDGVILYQTDGTNTMHFQYDEHQSPIGFIYNENQYYYITNISGDIIGITESNGLAVAEYFYDAWGNVEYVEAANANYEAVANANPLRYRGYYFDTETGYYYLQSRYYDPSICRFINADIPNIAQQYKEDINGLNVFAYCCNEPINHIDCNGYWGADIHYGRNHKKGKNYDGTYEWAILAKFKSKYATEIAKGDVDVDDNKNTTPNPLKAINADTGLANRQKYHFNRAPSGKTDTRTEQGNRFYKSAVSSFKSAIKNYNSNKAILDKQFFNKNDKKYKNLLSGLQRERDSKIALVCFVLGKVLHCYQDIYSHGNIAAGVLQENIRID